jgi:methylated-DNA-protein-cysteine methyltransferase-like protein
VPLVSLRKQPIKITAFTQKVMALIKQIPRGQIASYGQIAALAGKPHGARGVGWILSSSAKTHKLPWQRVVNSKGKISFSKKSDEFAEQRKLLRKEGVAVSAGGAIDMAEFGWKKKKRAPRSGPQMFR